MLDLHSTMWSEPEREGPSFSKRKGRSVGRGKSGAFLRLNNELKVIGHRIRLLNSHPSSTFIKYTTMSTKPSQADAKESFWDLIDPATEASRFKVQMKFTEHKSGKWYWRHEWTKARSRDRLVEATLERHRKAAIEFCLAETATERKGPVVPPEHDAYLAERSLSYNGDQHGGGCLLWAEKTVKTDKSITYRISVGDDALPTPGGTTTQTKTRRESKRSSERKSRSKNKSRESSDGAGRSSVGCVSS